MNILKDNPTFTTLLGLCPALAVTTSVTSALGMAGLTLLALIGSNGVLKALKASIPKNNDLLVKVIVVSTFVSLLQLIATAFLPSLTGDLGIYFPLIIINVLVLCELPSPPSHALKQSLGFGLALLIMGTLRELLGSGTFMGFSVLPDYYPMLIMILPAGGFLLMGFILAGLNWLKARPHE